MMEEMEIDYDAESDDDDSSSENYYMSGSDSLGSSFISLFSDDEVDFSTEDSEDLNSPDMESVIEFADDVDSPLEEETTNPSEHSENETTGGAEIIASPVNRIILGSEAQASASDVDLQHRQQSSGINTFEDGSTPISSSLVTDVHSEEIVTDTEHLGTSISDTKTLNQKLEKSFCSQHGADDDCQNCPICFETWTSSGSHRLVSLKCGHLFGLSCIERWLKGTKGKCPQCNAPARKNDIRNLYVKNLKALDTSERDQALRDLENEKELRRRAELEAANMRLKYQMSIQECEKLKKELMEYQSLLQKMRSSRKRGSGALDASAPVTSKHSSFVLEKTLDINKEGGCRLLGISSFFPMLIITQESSCKMFPGYGIKKVSTLDMKSGEFVFIHQKPIRDLAFHSYDSLILTTALDKTIKLTNIYSNTTVQTYPLLMDAWSCNWSKDDSCCFYVGLKNGTTLQFDTRMTGNYVQQLQATGHNSPVVGMQYFQKSFPNLEASGPVTLQLSSCCFYEKKNDNNYQLHPLPVEGNFTSLSLEPSTGHFLVSCRPSAKHSKVTHMLCEMSCSNVSEASSVVESMYTFNVVQTVQGGSTQVKLSRSKAFLNPGNESSVLVCAGDDNAKAALIWDVNSGQCLQQLKSDSSVLDVCNFRVNHDHFLSTLTEHTLRVYRWNKE